MRPNAQHILSCGIAADNTVCVKNAEKLANRLHLPLLTTHDTSVTLLLVVTQARVELRFTAAQSPGPLYVDFLSGPVAHRHRHGGGRKQLLARALGLNNRKQAHTKHPTVLDLTAGLGRDAFVLASLGCDVTMVERSPIIATLLEDGLQRAQQAAWFTQLKLRFIRCESMRFLHSILPDSAPDIIYLDPMFPDSKKSALAKKDMQFLQHLIGKDADSGDLLPLACKTAKERVVVKRARLAPTLSALQPTFSLAGKSSRFDVYLRSAMK